MFTPFPGAKNLEVSVTGPTTITFLIDITNNLGPSSSGKTFLIATTSGNKPLGATNAILGLNCFVKPKGSGAPNMKAVVNGVADAFSKGLRDLKGVTLEYDKATTQLKVSIDLSHKVGPSKSGTTEMVATTSGNLQFGKSGMALGVNCYTKTGVEVDVSQIDSVSSGDAQHHNISSTVLEGKHVRISVDCTKPLLERKGKYYVAETQSTGVLFPMLENLRVRLTITSSKKTLATPAAREAVVDEASAKKNPVTTEITEDGKLVFQFDGSVEGEKSSTGQTMVCASMRGAIPGVGKDDAVKVTMFATRKLDVSDSEGGGSSSSDDDDESGSEEEEENPKKKTKPTPAKKQTPPPPKKAEKKAIKKEESSEDDAEHELPKLEDIKAEIEKIQGTKDLDQMSVKELTKEVAEALKYAGEPRDLKDLVKKVVSEL